MGLPIGPLTSTAFEQFAHHHNQRLNTSKQRVKVLKQQIDELDQLVLRLEQEMARLAQSLGDHQNATSNVAGEAGGRAE